MLARIFRRAQVPEGFLKLMMPPQPPNVGYNFTFDYEPLRPQLLNVKLVEPFPDRLVLGAYFQATEAVIYECFTTSGVDMNGDLVRGEGVSPTLASRTFLTSWKAG